MQRTDDSQTLKAVAVFAFLLVALCFTGYQTANGYKSAIGTLPAILLACLCAGILGLLSLSMRGRLRDGKSTIGIWAGAAIVSGVSFAGNFNAFYTGFIKDELIMREMEQKRSQLVTEYADSQRLLNDMDQERLASQVNGLKSQLRIQILNDGDPGLGAKARKILAQIEFLLHAQLTELAAPNPSRKALEDLANRYDTAVDQLLLSTAQARDNAAQKKDTLEKNRRSFEAASTALDQAMAKLASVKSAAAEEAAIAAIEQTVQNYRDIASATAAIVSPKQFPHDAAFSLESDKVGNIDFSFNSAKTHGRHMAVWLSVFLSLFIDMGVPLVIWLIHSPADRSMTSLMGRSATGGKPELLS
jgi:hypothetical protein